MSDYINREIALSKLYHDGEYICDVARVYQRIEEMPGIPITKCRDCKYAKEIDNCFALDGETPLYECGYVDFPHKGSSYCSWGRSVDG